MAIISGRGGKCLLTEITNKHDKGWSVTSMRSHAAAACACLKGQAQFRYGDAVRKV